MIERQLQKLMVAVFTFSIGFGMMTPAIPIFAHLRFQANEWELGILGAIVAVPYVFSPAIFGKLSDRVGRKPIIISAIVLYALTSASYFFASSIWEFALLRILEGIAFSAIWPSAEAFVGDNAPPSIRSKAVGLYSVAWSSGYMVGPFVLGLIITAADVSYSFFATALFLLASLFMVVGINMRGKNDEIEAAQGSSENGTVLTVIYTMILWGATMLSFFFLFPAFATNNGIEASTIAYIVGVVGIMRTAVFALHGRIMGALGRLVLPIGMLCLVCSMAPLWAYPSIWGFIISAIFLGLYLGLTYAYSLLHMINRPSRGLYAGLFESAIGIGELVGPLSLGYLGYLYGTASPFLLLLILGGASFFIVMRRINGFSRRAP
ncbi:MAG: MFS transporter [Candidatus Methanomethylicia archaeon]|nr:MFS transporter [Candidatus Methanomethylicia archaeon]